MSGDNGEVKNVQEIKLTITQRSDGALSVEGPGGDEMYDEPICLYLLEKGKDFVKFRNAQVMAERKQKPGLFVPNRFGRRHP